MKASTVFGLTFVLACFATYFAIDRSSSQALPAAINRHVDSVLNDTIRITGLPRSPRGYTYVLLTTDSTETLKPK